MNSIEKWKLWKLHAVDDPDLVTELQSISSEKEIEDRFYRDLEFGTGGLRGVIGAGTNRMNIYVVRRATQGLCHYLKKNGLPGRVAIGYDSRIKSRLFAMEAARVIAANDLDAYIYPRLEPTPALSWAVRYLGCGAGICVTASHNPSVYNGYKVYGPDGCQITLAAAKAVLEEINKLDMFEDVLRADEKDERIHFIEEDCLEAFLDAVQTCSLSREGDASQGSCRNLKLVYTPLNGSGLECVKKILQRIGVSEVTVVPEQEKPDGHFPTCPYPNPEIREAMEKGLALCRIVKPDLLIGTDPDCDRMGAAVPDGEDYRLLTGNEMGLLLFDYICRKRLENGSMPKDPVAVTTIVSTDLADRIAERYGVTLRRVLTGFKFIGEQIGLLEKQGEVERFLFGFEESYGYLSGSHVRDKDAVNASMLCCEMAAWYKERGLTLAKAMQELYHTYGFNVSELSSSSFEGAEGMQTMTVLMEQLRSDPPTKLCGLDVKEVLDYQEGIQGLPRSNVLSFRAEDRKVLIRPSGTEPKMKLYLSADGESLEEAAQKTKALLKELRERYF